MQEKRLIKRILRGDRESADELIKTYYKEIYAFVYRQTSSKETSMDITQEIFISVLHTLHSFDPSRSSFRTWLYAVASNKIYDYHRSRSRRIIFEPMDISELNIADDSDFTETIETKETAKEAMELLTRQDKLSQQIVVLKIFGGFRFREIGDILAISENTVKTKYYGSLRKLKEELTK